MTTDKEFPEIKTEIVFSDATGVDQVHFQKIKAATELMVKMFKAVRETTGQTVMFSSLISALANEMALFMKNNPAKAELIRREYVGVASALRTTLEGLSLDQIEKWEKHGSGRSSTH